MAYTPIFTISPALLAEAERVAALRERIRASTVDLNGVPGLQKEGRVRSVQGSASLDGGGLTLAQVRALEGGEVPARASERDLLVIRNLFAALRYVEDNAAAKTVGKNDLIEVHRLLTDGIAERGEAGRYRTTELSSGEITAPAPTEVTRLMRELLDWWNGPAAQLPPLLMVSILHQRVLAIQPFAICNGRVARALTVWALFRSGFDAQHVLAVDEAYAEDGYDDAVTASLAGAGDGEAGATGDLGAWLEYGAKALRVAYERAWLRTQGLHGTARKTLALRPRQQQLLQLLRERGTLAPHEIWAELEVTRQGAIEILRPLIAAGIVEKVGGAKTGHYVLKGV